MKHVLLLCSLLFFLFMASTVQAAPFVVVSTSIYYANIAKVKQSTNTKKATPPKVKRKNRSEERKMLRKARWVLVLGLLSCTHIFFVGFIAWARGKKIKDWLKGQESADHEKISRLTTTGMVLGRIGAFAGVATLLIILLAILLIYGKGA